MIAGNDGVCRELQGRAVVTQRCKYVLRSGPEQLGLPRLGLELTVSALPRL